MTNNVATVKDFFARNPEVNFLRVIFYDISSIPRVYVVPKSSALEIAEKGFINSPLSPVSAVLSSTNVLIMDLVEICMDEIRPDWSSLKVCTFYPTHASVFSFCRQPGEGKSRNGYGLDPRTTLVRQIESAKEDGIDILVGLEIELLITELSNDFTKPPVVEAPLSTVGLRTKYTPVIDDIVLAIEKAGIRVQKFHPEDGIAGFFEIVLAPLPPLEAADAMVFCHECIKAICQQRDLKATLAPHPYEKGMDIGSHINMSISNPSGGNAESFLSAILQHLRAICAISMPSYNSSLRSSRLRGLVQWGRDNKTATVRERTKGLWEFRCGDATMNPFLTFAALIAVGMHGIRTKQPLTMKPNQGRTPLTEEEMKELGVTDKIPTSLQEALNVLKDDEVLKDNETGLGEEMIKVYTIIKEKDIAIVEPMPELQRRIQAMQIF